MNEYRTIELNGWTKVGEGGNGSTYVNTDEPDVILKINKPRLNKHEIIRHEFEVSKAVESLGIQTPIMHEIVRVGEAYAIIAQRIKGKKSLSKICHDEPLRTEEMARILSEKGKELFSTPCNKDVFPSRKQQLLSVIDSASFVSQKNRKMLKAFAETIPECETCIHGDFQTGNIIFTEGQYYWIDLDRFAYGDPMFDIGHLFLICNVYASMKRLQDIFHMTEEQLRSFWDAFAKSYTGLDNHSEFDALAGKFACMDMIVRTCFEKPTFAETVFFWIVSKKLIKKYFSE